MAPELPHALVVYIRWLRALSKQALIVEFAVLALFTFYGVLFALVGILGVDNTFAERAVWALTLLGIVSVWRLALWAVQDGPSTGGTVSALWWVGIASGLAVTAAAGLCHKYECPRGWGIDPSFLAGLYFVPTSVHVLLEVWAQRRRWRLQQPAPVAGQDSPPTPATEGDVPVAQHTPALWRGLLAATLFVPTLLAALAAAASFSLLPVAALWVLGLGAGVSAAAALVFGWPLVAALRQRGWLNAVVLCALAAALGALVYARFIHAPLAQLTYRVFPSHPLEIAGYFVDLHDVFVSATKTRSRWLGAPLGALMAAAFCVGAGVPLGPRAQAAGARPMRGVDAGPHTPPGRPLWLGPLAALGLLGALAGLAWLFDDTLGIGANALFVKTMLFAGVAVLAAAWPAALALRRRGRLRAEPLHLLGAAVGTAVTVIYVLAFFAFMADQYSLAASQFVELSSGTGYRIALLTAGGLFGLLTAAVWCAGAGIGRQSPSAYGRGSR